MLNTKSIFIIFLLQSTFFTHITCMETQDTQKQPESWISPTAYGALAFIPLLCAGKIAFDGNIRNEWLQFLLWGTIGTGLAYKGYQEAPDKKVYLATTCTTIGSAVIIPGIGQKIRENNSK